MGLAVEIEFAGYLGRDAIAERLQRAAIFVSPSDYEGFPLTLLEAMASGAPVVTTRTGPLSGDPAALPVKTVDATVSALATGIREVLDRPSEAAGRAIQARGVVEAHYGWDRVVDSLESIYRDTLRLAA